ncbi:MAG: hypothetical protein R3236_11430 [Phycisphaeraceae bacterium]|nr:hypothetical protein [Phycisphaeraceae bacterium]
MPMRWIGLVLFGLLAGCKLTYTVTMRPKDDGFVRTLQRTELKSKKGPDGKDRLVTEHGFPAAEAERLEEVYGAEASGDRPTFKGFFKDQTPADIGGAGTWKRLGGSFGTATYYIERVGGDLQLFEDLQQAGRVTDRAVDLLVGWFGSQLEDEPKWPALKKFLSGPLRRDAKDVAVLLWLSRSSEKASEQMVAHMAQLLIERGYTTADRIPADLAKIRNERTFELIQRLVARRMGVADGEPVPESLSFLSSSEAAEASFKKWYRSTDAYRRRHAEWLERKKTDPDLEEPTVDLQIDLKPLLGRGIFAKPHHIKLTLQTPEKPYATNGTWDAAASAVTWDRRYDGKRRLPTLVYATWAVPNERMQKKVFGSVVLENQALGEYLLGLHGMDPQLRQRFEAYLEGLQPDDRLRRLIGEYRNPDGKKPPVVDLLLEALKKTN